MRKTILDDSTLSTHLQNYKEDKISYNSAVMEVFNNPDYVRNVSVANKGRIVATLLYNLNKETFLQAKFDLPEVLLGCQILDSKRLVKQMIKKIAQVEMKIIDADENRAKKLKRIRKHLNDRKITAEKLMEDNTISFTLSRVKIVKSWVKNISEQMLTFRIVLYNRKLWKELADLCHFCPEDFHCDWFLTYCFTGNLPETSLPYQIQHGDGTLLYELYLKNPIPYELLRLYKDKISPCLKKAIAETENLRTVIWYIEEIGNEHIIAKRIDSGEKVDLPYGKLVSLIMTMPDSLLGHTLIRIAEEKLHSYNLTLPSPVAIFCDASGSMDVAIKTSAIVTSLLCAMTKAELSIFRTNNKVVQFPPRTVRESLQFALKTKADGGTAPASSLFPYLEQKKKVSTIIIISDQEENADIEGRQYYYGSPGKMFADIYQKYCDEVYPAKLIFITFGNSDQMCSAIKKTIGENLFNKRVTNYNFAKDEPDLRKLDIILAKLAQTVTEDKITVSLTSSILKSLLDVLVKNGRRDLIDSLQI